MSLEIQKLADAAPQVLSAYLDDCRPQRVNYLGGAGGFSGARFWRLETPRGTLCLRRWPVESPDRQQLAFIHSILSLVSRRGFTTVPLPIRNLEGQSFTTLDGHFWELSPWLPGIADYSRDRRPEKLAAAMEALGRWHLAAEAFPQLDRLPTASPGIRSRRSQIAQFAGGRLVDLSIAAEIGSSKNPEWSDLARIAELLFAAFFRLEPQIRGHLDAALQIRVPLQPCIRDIWHDHVLFEGNQVSGFVDFGAMRMETVAVDVARLLDSLAGDDLKSWQRGLEAYQSVRPLSDDELTLVQAFDHCLPLLAGLNWIDWVFRARRTFENPAEVTRRVKEIAGRVELLAATRRLRRSREEVDGPIR